MRAFWRQPRAQDGPKLPSMRLEWQAIFCALALMLFTVGAISALQARAGDRWVTTELTREAQDNARLFVHKFAEMTLASHDAAAEALTKITFEDPHIAFVLVTDLEGRVVAKRTRDPSAAESHRLATRCCAGRAPCETCTLVPIVGVNEHEGRAATVALWNADGTAFGHATLGIIDPAYTDARRDLARVALVAGLSVCAIATPFVAMGARRLALPLRRLALAAERLADGLSPEPIPLKGPLEIASVAHSFNRMASSLEEANAAILAINADLEHAVEQRTGELNRLNERLRVELAERAQFFRTISHDLGAPLRNTAGMLALLRRKHAERLPPDATERLDRIGACIELELDMIRDLLEVSRVGATEEHPERVESESVVDELRAAFEHDLRSKRIQLVVRRPLPTLHLERARLRQVLQNLLDNAIKYMGDSPKRFIDIVAWTDESGATFCVADTGPGIPHAEHESIFDMFRRASTATPDIKGSGVGLAAVKGIVERWGGTVHLDSDPGRGSRFVFTVPSERVVTTDAPGAASENRASSGGR
ncbi:MAG: HAMP domain-containing protein [Phycisphaeraceae bacterium]|nr:HAMP domain-containing protein [Phycisphaeraceae bacterium]